MVDVKESRVVHTCICVRTHAQREGEEESNARDARRGLRRAGGGLREARRERDASGRRREEGPGNATESRGGRRGNYGSFLTCERCA